MLTSPSKPSKGLFIVLFSSFSQSKSLNQACFFSIPGLSAPILKDGFLISVLFTKSRACSDHPIGSSLWCILACLFIILSLISFLDDPVYGLLVRNSIYLSKCAFEGNYTQCKNVTSYSMSSLHHYLWCHISWSSWCIWFISWGPYSWNAKISYP